MQYTEPSDDPLFPAHFNVSLPILSTIGVSPEYWLSDNYVNVLGCTDQHQFCNPRNGLCTPLTSYMQAFNALNQTAMNTIQDAIAMRISLTTNHLNLYHAVGGRGASALRAQETVTDLTQAPLPPDHWHSEVSSWFGVGLAKLQAAIVEYAAGPSNVVNGSHITLLDDPVAHAMCYSQKVRSTSGTISFSVLGVAIILILGTCIVLLNLVLEMIVGFVQQRLRWGEDKKIRWIMDDKFQLQRMAFEGAGAGPWRGPAAAVTVTEREGMVFGGLDGVCRDRLGFVGDYKSVQHSSAESMGNG